MFFNKSKKLLKLKEEELTSTLKELNETKENLLQLKESNLELINRYSDILDKDKVIQEKEEDIEKIRAKLVELNERYKSSFNIYTDLQNQISVYTDNLEIGSFGLYERLFNYETSEQYKDSITRNYELQKSLIKDDKAVICHTEWTVDGSKVAGRKMTNQYKKLMLYAFNGECDSLIAKVKWNNVTKATERVYKTFDTINKLGVTHNIEITNAFLNLKIEELSLTHEYELKKYEEKEEQRQIREQMRDEERAQREYEKAKKEAEDEERIYQKALEKAKQELGLSTKENVEELNEQIKLLESKLTEAQERKERAIAMAQLTKVGHIYVISNLGSFGEDVYKIGMTRRLDPMDRVRELGDASVPFHFDVHAIIYSENAPQLEYELHQKFKERRLNKVNHRKEFFRVSLDEIEEFINQHSGAEIEFTKLAEAKEYRETITMLEELNKLLHTEQNDEKFPTSLI